MKRTERLEREDLGFWQLPLPEDPTAKYRGEWERIPNLSNRGTVPFGYEVDAEDSSWLNPISTQLELLELAKEHVKRYSYRDVAAWLSAQSGRSISHVGLQRRIEIERKRKRLATLKRYYAQKLQRTLDQIETLEHKRTGAKKGKADESGSGSTAESR